MTDPEFVMVRDPPPPTIREPLRVKLFPARVTPDGLVVVIFPTTVVVPVPEIWFKDPTLIDLKPILLPLLITRDANGVMDPMLPVTEIFPVPAVKVKG